MTLHDVIEVVVGLVVGGVSCLVVIGLLVVVLVCVDELGDKVRHRVGRGRRMQHEQYRAEQALRQIRREAIHDMLEAERTQRYAHHDPSVIEGTAVEVSR